MYHFKIDENLPRDVSDLLNHSGYDSKTVLDQRLGGKEDSLLIKVCKKEGRSLITLDFDFADIRTYPPHDYPGVIVLRPPNQSKKIVLDFVKKILPFLKTETLNKKLWIVDSTRIRIRE